MYAKFRGLLILGGWGDVGGSVAQLLFLGGQRTITYFRVFTCVWGHEHFPRVVYPILPAPLTPHPPRAAAGYHAARLYRTLKGTDWKKASLLTAMLYPSVVFGMGFFLNFFIWGEHSSSAVSHDVITNDVITGDFITSLLVHFTSYLSIMDKMISVYYLKFPLYTRTYIFITTDHMTVT